eukprot:jgi/Undpi1/6159/HiC_scaffold_20.g08643.m1
MSLMDVAIAMVARSASADTDVRSEHQQKHQRPNHREAARATAGATAGEAAEEQVLHNPDVRAEIIAFVGGRQLQAYKFVGRVSMRWRNTFFEGIPRETASSAIVTSVPRTMEALGLGWKPGNGALKCAAGEGNIEVLNLLLESEVLKDARDLGEWGDGVFAAAAEAGHTHVLKFLIVAGCYKDQMGLKALEVAVESGSAAMLDCCDISDLRHSENGFVLDEQRVEAEAIVTPPLKEAIASRDLEMVRSLSHFVGAAGESGGWMRDQVLEFAEDGDMEMLLCLEDMIMCGRYEGLFLDTFWTAVEHGRFSAVAQLLTWWSGVPPHMRAETGGQQLVPDGVLVMVARLGHLGMLRWCKTNFPLVSRGFCLYCASVDGWSRVPADAAGAGHVDLVLWCLDNGWEYDESWMEAAAKEGRSHVIAALVGRGFACQVQVEQAARCDEGMERYLADLLPCEWH